MRALVSIIAYMACAINVNAKERGSLLKLADLLEAFDVHTHIRSKRVSCQVDIRPTTNGQHVLMELLLANVRGAALVTPSTTRRGILAGGVALASTSLPLAGGAAATGPITVLGASGKTGALCVDACIRRGLPVRALTRSGACPRGVDAQSPLLTLGKCDVRDAESLASCVAGSFGVIYAASASEKGGNAESIDNLGAVAAAKACLAAKVPRYVLISSTAVTRPESLGYKFTNNFVPGYARGVMDQKLLGERGVQKLYQADTSACTYSIVRPGGLEETSNVVGVGGLEASQGDVLAGVISRPDLAEFMVELILSNTATLDSSIEVYTTKSAQPCERRFKPFLKDERVARLHGTTWKELLSGLKADGDFFVPA